MGIHRWVCSPTVSNLWGIIEDVKDAKVLEKIAGWIWFFHKIEKRIEYVNRRPVWDAWEKYWEGV